ncbi:MAG: DNA-binding GntR family transcriptional regulator [Cyclobacteriaceae bacterium]|jgi:DNA-binding GntR family transcriptional regulator
MKSDSQSNTAYLELRRQILIMQLQPNTRLKEDEWAKKLNLGRVAIREALIRLLGEGLVTTGEKGGYFIQDMSGDDIRQIREVREILELAALKLAIERITEDQLDQLSNICDDFSTMAKKGYVSGACEADIKFHEKLVESSGNTRLSIAYHSSHIPIFHLKLGKTKQYLEDYMQTDREHRQLVEEIKNKNLKLAEQLLKNHFKRGELAVLDLA